MHKDSRPKLFPASRAMPALVQWDSMFDQMRMKSFAQFDRCRTNRQRFAFHNSTPSTIFVSVTMVFSLPLVSISDPLQG